MDGITNSPQGLEGVRMSDTRDAGCIPYVNNTTGVLHGHHFHSTVTDLQTPVYSSAPKGIPYIRNIQRREGTNYAPRSRLAGPFVD